MSGDQVDKLRAQAHLSQTLEAHGFDMDLINEVVKLREVENLMKQGRVRPEVYEALVDDVLNKKLANLNDEDINEENNTNNLNNVQKIKRSGSMIVKRLRGLVTGEDLEGNESNDIRRLNSKSAQKSDKFNSNSKLMRRSKYRNRPLIQKELGNQSRKRGASFEANLGNAPPELPARASKNVEKKEEKRTVIMEDELLKLGASKSGKPMWKKVHVTLYEDALEYSIKTKKGVIKSSKVIDLDEDFFVNGDPKEAAKADNNEDSEQVMEDAFVQEAIHQPHSFLLSDLDQKHYFAAEDSVKKEFWVTMLVQTLRDLSSNLDNDEERKKVNNGTQRLASSYNRAKKMYVDNQVRKTIKLAKVEDLTEENFAKQEEKWERQGAAMARQSVAMEWKKAELEQAKAALLQQEELKRQLAAKDQQLLETEKKLENADKEWQKRYDDLLEQKKEEARQRNELKREEQSRLDKEINALKRMSVVHRNSIRKGSSTFQTDADQVKIEDFERQIEVYKTKLKALQAALNVDVENLDWDGTLEDAENKMKELMKDLMSPDENIQREAQSKFDQWDNIIRNHADFKRREEAKWDSWEIENAEKNRDALNEMRQRYVPQIFARGCSIQELMDLKKIPRKAADRVFKNRIFKFFWMDPDSIAKIHAADLTNNYASQGLDIRELRAVYCCLPKEFQNDNDGKKKLFRDNIRNRLFELTVKGASGTLSSSETLNNAYRDKNVRDQPAPIAVKSNILINKMELPPSKDFHLPSRNMKKQAAQLELLFQKRGNAAPVTNASGSNNTVKVVEKKEKLNANDSKWDAYFKMEKAGLPEGAIANKMQKDGNDPALWPDLKRMRQAIPSALSSDTINVSSSNIIVSSNSLRAEVNPLADYLATKSDETNNDPLKQIKELKAKAKTSKTKTLATTTPSVKSKNRRPIANASNPPSVSSNVITSGADDLVQKATIAGTSSDSGTNNNAHGLADFEYGVARRDKKKTLIKKVVGLDDNLQQLQETIMQLGQFDAAEGGVKTVRFKDLSRYFILKTEVADLLVGLLIKAKRQGLIKYRGDMLFNGIHDEIKITLLE